MKRALVVRRALLFLGGRRQLDDLHEPHIDQMEVRLIDDCDRMAADLDQEVRNEEDRAKIHDQAHFAYPTYAKATALRRDNLRHSADELRAHLTKAKKALLELGEVT